MLTKRLGSMLILQSAGSLLICNSPKSLCSFGRSLLRLGPALTEAVSLASGYLLRSLARQQNLKTSAACTCAVSTLSLQCTT